MCVPCCLTGLTGAAEMEAHLSEAFGEGVLGGHVGWGVFIVLQRRDRALPSSAMY